MVLAAVTVVGWHRPVNVARDEAPPAGPEPLVEDLVEPVPERFAAWDAFVITWEVSGPAGEAVSSFSPAFGDNPCAALGRSPCWVRLAWADVSRWSLTASADRSFDGADPRQLSAGGLFYGVEGRELLGVLDTDRLPGLHVCHELAERRSAAADVTAAAGGAEVFVLERRGWGAASCLGPRGIPVGIRRGDVQWRMSELERRAPTDDEIGVMLVAGRAAFTPAPGCDDPAGAAPGWRAAAAAAAGHEPEETGAGITFAVPGAWLRPACAWVTPAYLPVGARAHRLTDGWVVDELLHPRPVVSAVVGDGRVWLAFTDEGPAARGARERDVFVLGEALRRLVAAA